MNLFSQLYMQFRKTQKKNEKAKTIRLRQYFSLVLLLLIPAALFYLTESYTHNPFETMLPGIQLLNILFFELVMTAGLFLSGSGRIALFIQTLIFAGIGLANYFVIEFRSAPVMPWDLLSISTAASVADNYSYRLDDRAMLVLAGFLLCLLLSFTCNLKVTRCRLRLIGAGLSLVLLIFFVNYVQSRDCLYRFRLYDKLFTPTTMAYKDGTVVAFCMQLPYLFVEEPEGYSIAYAEELLRNYSEKEQSSKNPDIIVVMNEAFSDLNLLGDIPVKEDYIPFVRSLLEGADNTQSGYLHVSVLGGNTANTEYEYLTGQSMAFLPQGSIPYQQYLKQDTFSLASHLKEAGYRTVAIHPYNATGWQRHEVYPRLGFDRFLSLDDFQNSEKIRKYISDKAGYDRMIRLLEEKPEDEPWFLFYVTMQNHSSYTEEFENFTPDVQVEGSDDVALSQYLSLLKVSDREIQNLISYFERREEDTLIVFFGDHQPTDSVVRDLYTQNNRSFTDTSHQQQCLRYQVPFFIWANYELEEASGLHLSPNHLGTLTLKGAGQSLSPFHRFLDELQRSFPVISSIEVQDAEGRSYEFKEKSKELQDYAILQYYLLMEEDK